MRYQRTQTNTHHANLHGQVPAELVSRDFALRGRRRPRDTANSVTFLATVEGVQEYDGHVRSANGIRWQVA